MFSKSKILKLQTISYRNDDSLFLDFNSTTTITDESTLGGNNSWTVIPSGVVSDVIDTVTTKSGSGSLTGINSKAIKHALTSSLSLGTGDFTFQCWFYPRSNQPAMSNGYVPIFGGQNYTNGILFYRPTGYAVANALHWYPLGLYSTVGLNIDTWNHIRLVRQSAKTSCFINGTNVSNIVGGLTDTQNLTTLWSAGFHILREPSSSRYCNGLVDCFQLFNYSLGTSNFTPSSYKN